MITGEHQEPDRPDLWNAFWSGGISNPLEVIEQITYLLFLRRLDDLHTLEENKSARLKNADGRAGSSPRATTTSAGAAPYDDLRWSRFKHFAASEMYAVVSEHVFPSCARSAATAPPTRTT
jgi:type I restriction enzyme M protein